MSKHRYMGVVKPQLFPSLWHSWRHKTNNIGADVTRAWDQAWDCLFCLCCTINRVGAANRKGLVSHCGVSVSCRPVVQQHCLLYQAIATATLLPTLQKHTEKLVVG